MNFFEVDLTYGHFVSGVFKVVFEQLEILFVDFPHQMHRQIVKIILNRVQALWAVPFAFVKSRDCCEVHFVRGVDFVENLLHPVVELLGPENLVVASRRSR